jgi:hypothetical protein
MRTVGIWIANPLDYGYFAFVIQSFEWGHIGVEAKLVVDREHLIFGDSYSGSIFGVEWI